MTLHLRSLYLRLHSELTFSGPDWNPITKSFTTSSHLGEKSTVFYYRFLPTEMDATGEFEYGKLLVLNTTRSFDMPTWNSSGRELIRRGRYQIKGDIVLYADTNQILGVLQEAGQQLVVESSIFKASENNPSQALHVDYNEASDNTVEETDALVEIKHQGSSQNNVPLPKIDYGTIVTKRVTSEDFGTWWIVLDNQETVAIGPNGIVELKVAPGTHTALVKAGAMASRPVTLSVELGKPIRLKCGDFRDSASNGMINLYLLLENTTDTSTKERDLPASANKENISPLATLGALGISGGLWIAKKLYDRANKQGQKPKSSEKDQDETKKG